MYKGGHYIRFYGIYYIFQFTEDITDYKTSLLLFEKKSMPSFAKG